MLGGFRPAVLVLLLLAAPLAGCLGALEDAPVEPTSAGTEHLAPGTGIDESKLTEDLYGILPKQVAYVAASTPSQDLEGEVDLYTEVHLPDGQGPWPVIITSSPYNDHTGQAEVDAELFGTADLVQRYVPKGYAVVIADVRGTGNSEGCMNMMGAREQADQADLVRWAAEQPWSTGKVAMHGVSYVGTTPHEALIMAPEDLATVVTVAGVTNQWRNTYMNGVPYAGRFYPITYEATEGAPPPQDPQRGPSWALNAASGACGQEEALQAMSPGTYEKGVYASYWDERNFTQHTANVTAPILYSQGFDDRAVNPSEAIDWFEALDVPKKALFHQGGHMYPPREDYRTIEHAWFDHWLKGLDNGVMETPTVEVLTGADKIRVDDTWPPAEANLTRFHLAPGSLTPQAPDESQETYLADNARGLSMPSTGTPADETLANPLAPAGLPSALVFTSEPLAEATYVAGEPRMHLVLSVDAENTYVLFDLYELDPASGERDWLGEGWFNAHLREGFDRSAPLTPGEETVLRFRFEPADQILEAGHQLQLVLRGHDSNVLPFDQPATRNTVHYGPEASWLELPLLDAPVLFDRPEDL